MPLGVLAHSAMGRHVGALALVGVHLDAADLSAVADRMAHLRELHYHLAQLPPTGQPLAFPSALRSLDVGVSGSFAASDANAIIAAVGRLPLLEWLAIRLAEIPPLISFAPLAALPQLLR